MRSIKIYTLSDPHTNEIRYVGMTSKSLEKRLRWHWVHISQNNYRVNWIKSLKVLGVRPTIKLLDEVDQSVWKETEIYWIAQFKAWGFNLVNSSLGGDGAFGYKHTNPYWRNRKRSVENKRKMSEAMKIRVAEGRWDNPNPKGSKRDPDIIKKSSLGHRKPVELYTLDNKLFKEFSSIKEAASFLKLGSTAVCNSIKLNSITKNKYRIKYKN